jgi:hypothetical protein
MSWFSFTGRLQVKVEVDTTALPSHLADCLRDVHASTVEIVGNRVTFTGRYHRFMSNWSVLVPFDSGELTIEGYELRFQVNFRQMVLIGTVMVGLMPVLWRNNLVHPLPLFVFPLAWLWLVGGNLLVGILRFKRFLHRALMSASPHQPLVGSSWR